MGKKREQGRRYEDRAAIFFTSGPWQLQLPFVVLHVSDLHRRPNLHNQHNRENQDSTLSKLKEKKKKSIFPELDQNFIFPNSSLVLAELGFGSRFREHTGARHTISSSWHHSLALAASTLTPLWATATISLPKSSKQTHEASSGSCEVEGKGAGSRSSEQTGQ